jgi:4'-phosphopantetheinyl transferase
MAGSIQCVLNGNLSWQPVADTLMPQRNTVYLLRGKTAELFPLYDRCYAVLDDTEKERAMHYRQAADRQRYVIQHGLLRVLLGWYFNKPLFSDAFRYGEHGKPYLMADDAHRCFFSLSSSSGTFLIAIGDKEIGIDMEQSRPDFDYQDIAIQYFSKEEQIYIATSAHPEQTFFLLWTRKEALLKVTGKGINEDLHLVPVLNGVHLLPANYGHKNWITQSYMSAPDGEVISVTYPKPETVILTRQVKIEWGNALFN